MNHFSHTLKVRGENTKSKTNDFTKQIKCSVSQAQRQIDFGGVTLPKEAS